MVQRHRGNEVFEKSTIRDLRFRDDNTQTLTAAKTLAVTDQSVQFLDPGGADRNVDLPAEADSNGKVFVIVNRADADEKLTIRDDAPATVGIVPQNSAAIVVCNGTVWEKVQGLSDRAAAIVTLTDSTTGVASDTVNDTTASVKDDIASLAAKINAILTVLRTHGLIAP